MEFIDSNTIESPGINILTKNHKPNAKMLKERINSPTFFPIKSPLSCNNINPL